jgi:hypothetical protein
MQAKKSAVGPKAAAHAGNAQETSQALLLHTRLLRNSKQMVELASLAQSCRGSCGKMMAGSSSLCHAANLLWP